VAQVPPLERPREDQLGGHCRHGGLSPRPRRIRLPFRGRSRGGHDRCGGLRRAPRARKKNDAQAQR
jgi:hypothetical protein